MAHIVTEVDRSIHLIGIPEVTEVPKLVVLSI